MKIKPIGANQTELHLDNGTIVLFSYQTPVAAKLTNGEVWRTDEFFSRTTSGHINNWLLKHLRLSNEAELMPQYAIANLVEGKSPQ